MQLEVLTIFILFEIGLYILPMTKLAMDTRLLKANAMVN